MILGVATGRLITVEGLDGAGKTTLVAGLTRELAARGRELLGVVEGIYRDIEAEWAVVVGERGVERLRRDLVRVVTDSNEGDLPPVRPTW